MPRKWVWQRLLRRWSTSLRWSSVWSWGRKSRRRMPGVGGCKGRGGAAVAARISWCWRNTPGSRRSGGLRYPCHCKGLVTYIFVWVFLHNEACPMTKRRDTCWHPCTVLPEPEAMGNVPTLGYALLQITTCPLRKSFFIKKCLKKMFITCHHRWTKLRTTPPQSRFGPQAWRAVKAPGKWKRNIEYLNELHP